MANKEDIFGGEPERAARAQLERIGPWMKRRYRDFSPDGSALLVLDMQDYFLDPASHAFIPGAPSIVPIIRDLAAAFLADNQKVLFTRHINTEADAGMMAEWWRKLLSAEQPTAEITEGLKDLAGEVIEKTQYDAFLYTDLEEVLRASGIKSLVLTGVMTHLCVETTARAAFTRGFEVFVPADAVATYDVALQEGSLRAMAHGFAVPLLSADITGRMK